MIFKSCKDCTERTVEPNCHMYCRMYLAEVAKNSEVKRVKNTELSIMLAIKESIFRCMKD